MKRIELVHPVYPMSARNKISDYLFSGKWNTEGKDTIKLEQRFAKMVKSNHAIAVTSGTTALMLCGMMYGIGKGDKVIVPSLTMVASATAFCALGATIVPLDTDDSGCLSYKDVCEYFTSDVKAIVYVSLNGRCGDIDKMKSFCKIKGIPLIEDACQSLGSYHDGRQIGTIGDVGCFSFSPHKLISTGNGGMIVTNDETSAIALRRLKNFGRVYGGSDNHEYIGINAKFTDIQAILCIEQMRQIRKRVSRKRHIYSLYKKNLNGIVDFVESQRGFTPWMVDVYVDCPAELKDRLERHGIQTRLMYPTLYEQKCFKEQTSSLYQSNSYFASSHGIWLPSAVDMSDEDVIYVCNCIRGFYK